MHKSKPAKTRTASKDRGQVQFGQSASKGTELALDDFLTYIQAVRKAYRLSEATFGLEQIEKKPAARPALEAIVGGSLARHGQNIYAKPQHY